MPLSEFYGCVGKGEIEGSKQKTTTRTTDFVHGNEIMELVWENGQVLMQGQSSRSRKASKIPPSNNFNFQADRFRDKETASQTTSKLGKYGTIDSIYSDIATSVQSGRTGLNHDDDMEPWFHYPLDDTLQHDYCPDFLPELSGVTVNEHSNRNSFASMEKRGRSNQIYRDSHNASVHNGLSLRQDNASRLPSTSSAKFYSWSSPQGQPSVPSGVSSISDIFSTSTNNIHHDVSGNLVSPQGPAGFFAHLKMQKQDCGVPGSNPNVLNFSHFSKPAAMAGASIQNVTNLSVSGSICAGRMGDNDKFGPAIWKNPAESRNLDPNCLLPKEMNVQTQSHLVSAKMDLKALETKAVEESYPGRQSDTVFQDDGKKNDKSPNQNPDGIAAKGVPDTEKAAEHVGPSSVCSGNSAERASNDPTVNFKRKSCCYTEESEGQSENVEEESVGVKKAAPARGGSGSKRSRAAEVHNLSERRRRDRINEKMRALQELIPNCNKVDKASMLDEAIEYLKTLQLQVQIMSMGAGLYMPPMMLPSGIQHFHAAHLPHFSPMSVGMGMGFGMNMLDMNGAARGCSAIPMAPMQRSHFPSPPISGTTSFHGMAGANPQLFGHPSQGIPVSVAGVPLVSLSGQPLKNSGTEMSPLSMGVNIEAPMAAPNSNTKDLAQTTNSHVIHGAEASMSLNLQSTQNFQETNGNFHQSSLHKNDQRPDGDGSAAAANLTKTNDTVPSAEAGCD